jgi:hypothetical protein
LGPTVAEGIDCLIQNRVRENTDGRQRSRHGAAAGNEIAEDAEEDGEEQDYGKTRKEKMILFMHEDRAYRSWVTHHRNGFVLECSRKPSKHHLMLHRATCPSIKHSATKKTHWTTGQHMKACSLDAEELNVWAREQTEAEPSGCVDCLIPPDQHAQDHPLHLTKLDQEILSFVLELATLNLDDETGSYWLNIGMVAKCLDKTPGQLSAALHRLVDDGMLTLTEKVKPAEPLSVTCGLFPTVLAMKTLPAYQDRSDEEIEIEMKALTGETE